MDGYPPETVKYSGVLAASARGKQPSEPSAYEGSKRLLTSTTRGRMRTATAGSGLLSGREGGEVYSYEIDIRKLTTWSRNSRWICSSALYDLYPEGKLMQSKGHPIVTDWLGSLRSNSEGIGLAYFPYGEERTHRSGSPRSFTTTPSTQIPRVTEDGVSAV